MRGLTVLDPRKLYTRSIEELGLNPRLYKDSFAAGIARVQGVVDFPWKPGYVCVIGFNGFVLLVSTRQVPLVERHRLMETFMPYRASKKFGKLWLREVVGSLKEALS